MAHQHNVPAHERRIHELDQNVERVFDVRKVRTSSVQKKSCSIMQIFVLKINFKIFEINLTKRNKHFILILGRINNYFELSSFFYSYLRKNPFSTNP